MIIIKFHPGSLGHFLGFLIGDICNPFKALDFGEGINSSFRKDILHTGAFDNLNDAKILKEKNKDYKLITHNNLRHEDWINNLQNTKNIFINLDSNFIEYRLNFILKIPSRNRKLNNFAINHSWKNFKNPVAYDEARRIVRLHKGLEQVMKINSEHDVVFKFNNFYETNLDKWIQNFIDLAKQIDINLNRDLLKKWFECFRKGQKEVIDRASILYRCIEHKKFSIDLTEHEKGMIIGYDAVENNIDAPIYFEQKYYEFSQTNYNI